MLKVFKLSATVLIFGLSTCVCFGAGTMTSASGSEESREQSWNREQKPATMMDARALVQQKAELRAEQRQNRLATSAWYGITNSRPTGTATPFTARYGSVWEMPGGKPYSWYPPNTQPGCFVYLR
jgi:hypothetical protein